MLALLVLVACKQAWLSLVGCTLALSEGEADDCMQELACLLHKSALAEKEPWPGAECARRGSVARFPTGRSALAARGGAEAHTSLQGAPSTSLRILRWNKTAEKRE